MASPQVENGFVKIANELYDAIIRFPFTKNQRNVLDAIIRKTYGFGKKYDRIVSSQMAKMTGLDAGNCRTAKGQLIAMNVALNLRTPHGQLIGINKNYEQWNPALNLRTRVKSTHTINNTYITATRKKPRTPTPAEFPITPDMMGWVRSELGNVPKELVARERDSFLDRNRAQDQRYSNWNAAWKNWMRNWWFKYGGQKECSETNRSDFEVLDG